MRKEILIVAAVVVVIGAGALFVLGLAVEAVARVADWQRWNDNDDRKEIKESDTEA